MVGFGKAALLILPLWNPAAQLLSPLPALTRLPATPMWAPWSRSSTPPKLCIWEASDQKG